MIPTAMTSATSLAVALAGCGRWGGHVLRDLLSLGAEVHVVDPDPAARQRALEAGARSVAPALDGALDVDGGVVATPATAHDAAARGLLARGVPVFVEKPLAADAGVAEALAAAGGPRLFVMEKWRYHQGVEELGHIARSGELGRVLGVRSTRAGWGASATDVDGVWTLAPHELSIGREVLGHLPPCRWAFAESVDGEPTSLLAALGDDPWHLFEVSLRHPTPRREIRLHCERGVAVLESPEAPALRIVRGRAAEPLALAQVEWRPIGTEPPLLRELRAFVDHLRGGPPPRSSGAEGAETVRRLAEIRARAGLR